VSGVLGLSVGPSTLHALLLAKGAIRWAGTTTYGSRADLTEAVARLVGECGERPGRARIVLDRRLVQLRSVTPAPPVKTRNVAAYVALEAPRLFRNGAEPLVTDAVIVHGRGKLRGQRTLWSGAASEAIVRALLAGCREAGLEVEALGPAADVLAAAACASSSSGALAFPNGTTTEVVELVGDRTLRSRLVAGAEAESPTWVPPLAALGPDAPHFAAAYAAARVRPRLLFLPRETHEARRLRARHRLRWLAATAAGLWLAALGVYALRLGATARAAERDVLAMGAAVDSALALRRDLNAAAGVLGTVETAAEGRSRHLVLLGEITRVLPESSVVVALRIAPDSTVRLAGYAASGARVLAQLEAVRPFRGVRFEGPLVREVLGAGTAQARTWDRFAIIARLERAP
jgi:hypothetical protein